MKTIGKKLIPHLIPGKKSAHQKILDSIISAVESTKGDFDLEKIYQIIENRLDKIGINFAVLVLDNRHEALTLRYFSGESNGGSVVVPDGIGLYLNGSCHLKSAIDSCQAQWLSDELPDAIKKILPGVSEEKYGTIIAPIVIKDETIGLFYFFSFDLEEKFLPLYSAFSQEITRLIAYTILYEENRRSEEKYRMLVDNAQDGVAIISTDQRFTFANKSFCRITGYSPDELENTRFSRLIHPDDKTLVLDRFKDRLGGKKIINSYEFRIRNKNGQIIDLSYIGTPILQGGKIIGIQAVIRDITENKKFARQIKEAKDRYEQIIDTIDDGICVISREYKITSCNRAFAENIGLPIREILGRPCREMIPQYENKLLSGHCAYSVCDKTCGASEVFSCGGTRIYTEENRDRRGRPHYHNISVFPAKNLNGEIYQVVMTIRNITKEREAEEEIRRLNEINQRILDAAPISIIALDNNGLVTAANRHARELMERPGQKLINRNLLETGEISKNPTLVKHYRDLLKRGKAFFYNDVVYLPRGENETARSLNIIAVPLFGKNGKTDGAISMALDNTEAKSAKEKLEELNRELEKKVVRRTQELDDTNKKLSQAITLKPKFIADASHELRTPLTVIQGNLDLAIREADKNGCEPPESLAMILGEVERMTRILSDLTMLTNVDSGAEQISYEEVNLGRLIKSVGASLKVLADQKKIALLFHKGAKPIKIMGDEAKLEKLLLNIVRNAIKYSNPKGLVRIWADSDGQKAWLAVEDKGIGIPSEELPFIFERFYRVDKARSRDEGGTGLGLSICKWIADRHGARIEVESMPDKGSIFRVILPLDYKNQPLDQIKP